MNRALLPLALIIFQGACVSGSVTSDPPELQDPSPEVIDGGDGPDNNKETMCEGEQGCSVGRFVCIGDEIHVCRQMPDGCTTFVLNETCQGGRVCREALCVEAGACIDTDGDSHGLNCEAGADCDDMNSARFNGADELCDNIDNDCDGIEDEGEVCRGDCETQQCSPGSLECVDANTARECRADSQGCGQWADPVRCNGQCDEGICQDPDCIDNDGDLRGEGCVFGADCDDSDSRRFEGNEEVCDGLDNDCDTDIDEDFDDLGEPCMRGQGVCARAGVSRCAPGGTGTICDAVEGVPETEICGNGRDDDCDGRTDEGFDSVGSSCEEGQGACLAFGTVVCGPEEGTQCDAEPGRPTSELCDGVDNDCNGIADDGGVCGCINDDHEPDQRSSDGFLLARGNSTQGTLCGADRDGADWINLGRITAGQEVSITIEYDSPQALMHMELYAPNFAFIVASPLGSSTHSLTHRATSSGNHFLWLFPNQNPEPGITYTLTHNQ